MIILGVDPGIAALGYGVLEAPDQTVKKTGKKPIYCLDYGLIQTKPDRPFPQRLKIISCEFKKILKKHRPDVVAIESVFFFKNLKTFIPVSRAEGVIILEAAKLNIPVVEFTPLQVKARMTGYGRAEKKDVQKRIVKILNLKEIPKPDDVADALGVALCVVLVPVAKQ